MHLLPTAEGRQGAIYAGRGVDSVFRASYKAVEGGAAQCAKSTNENKLTEKIACWKQLMREEGQCDSMANSAICNMHMN